jgi:hypothetical protein
MRRPPLGTVGSLLRRSGWVLPHDIVLGRRRVPEGVVVRENTVRAAPDGGANPSTHLRSAKMEFASRRSVISLNSSELESRIKGSMNDQRRRSARVHAGSCFS